MNYTRSIEVMNDYSEIIPYDRIGVPLYIHSAQLSIFSDLRVGCHWHEDIEWVRILDHSLRYHVNGIELLLQEGDTLMINSRQMHDGFSDMGQDCHYECLVFHPSLFGSNSKIQQQYIEPITHNASIPFIHFHADDILGKQVGSYIHEICELKKNYPGRHELKVIQTIFALWNMLLDNLELLPAVPAPTRKEELDIQKNMVSYLYNHYADKITLNEIAASGHVSRSKCCQIFKHYLQQTPIDFLNNYRLQVSCQLLRNTRHNITDIALSCGFRHLSYYSKLFLETYGMTPREYRKKYYVNQ